MSTRLERLQATLASLVAGGREHHDQASWGMKISDVPGRTSEFLQLDQVIMWVDEGIFDPNACGAAACFAGHLVSATVHFDDFPMTDVFDPTNEEFDISKILAGYLGVHYDWFIGHYLDVLGLLEDSNGDTFEPIMVVEDPDDIDYDIDHYATVVAYLNHEIALEAA